MVFANLVVMIFHLFGQKLNFSINMQLPEYGPSLLSRKQYAYRRASLMLTVVGRFE